MKKLWKNNDLKTNKLVEQYCFAEGVVYDNQLVEEDVAGSAAHAAMLYKIGIIKKDELVKLKTGLKEIVKMHKNGKFLVAAEDEDIHTKIENYLTEKYGDIGKKIHTGRSRNDQILVDLRLYSKKKISTIITKVSETSQQFADIAKKYEFVPMPGFTHMQKAMPSSVGMWLGSFAEQLSDQITVLKAVYKLIDQSPLGSGAAYGVSLPINREMTAKILGFSKVQNNSLYCQSTRVTFQLSILQTLVQIMIPAARFAQDLLFFTTNDLNYFSVDESITTGSSIMPQKKNLDIMEMVRAKTHEVISYQQLLSSQSVGLISGYNADFGASKGPFMESVAIVIETLKIIDLTLSLITPNKEVLKKACSKEIYTTHMAYQYVKDGQAFRDAYLKVKDSLNNLPYFDPVKFLHKSKHAGGTGNLRLRRS